MQSSKLKNIVLLILALTNALLLTLMLSQRLESRQAQRQTLSDAVELLAQHGITVDDPDSLPLAEFPPVLELERDPEGEFSGFSQLLGEDTTLTQRGLVAFYEGAKGKAEVRGDGGFSVTLAPGAYPLSQGETPPNHALKALERIDFQGEITQGGDAPVLTQCFEGTPVFSCQVTAVYEEGSLVELKGNRLVGKPAKNSQNTKKSQLSTPALLVRFRGGIQDSGDAVTAIRSAQQGYILTSSETGKLQLSPCLNIVTDTNRYLLSAISGDFQKLS